MTGSGNDTPTRIAFWTANAGGFADAYRTRPRGGLLQVLMQAAVPSAGALQFPPLKP